jgi:hypothetical protein
VSGRTYIVKVYRHARFGWIASARTADGNSLWWMTATGCTRRQAIRRIKRKLRKHECEMAWQHDEEQVEVTL